MAEQKGLKEYNTFVKGIVTEAGPLTFPENASLDEDNMVLNHDGSRERRLGIDYENNYVEHNTGVSYVDAAQLAISSHHWRNVADNASLSFCVVQFGTKLYIFDASKVDITNNFLGSLDFASKKSTYSPTIGQANISTSSGSGVLIVVSKEINPFYISYDAALGTFSTTDISITIRDFWGVDDGLAVATRPTSLSTDHKYNLYNQGWPVTTYAGHIKEDGTVVNTPSVTDPIAQTYTTLNKYPSNADLISLGRRDATAGGSTYIRYYEPDSLTKVDLGNTHAPQGHFIIDAFNRGTSRNTVSGLSLSGTDVEAGRPETTAFFAGRVFYSGVASNSTTSSPHKKINYNGFIFFSQVLQDLEQIGKCYQEADPTSEEIADLIETDGGTIHIPEAGHILKLVVKQNTLVVIADNGVWEVTGGELGFRATEFQVLKVTNVGAISAGSIINAEGNILYWSEGGIYALAADQISMNAVAKNISEGTIQSLYNNISNTAKIYCTSTYNSAERQLKWLYSDNPDYSGSDYRSKYNRELVYDSYLGAFYTNSIEDSNPFVAGYVETTLYKSEVDTQEVVVSAIPVVVGTDDVLVTKQISIGDIVKTKYLTIIEKSGTMYGTISEYRNTSYLDWYSYDSTGVDYLSYLITGYETLQSAASVKNAPYLVMYFRRTEDGFDVNNEATNPSSCKVQAQWNWSDSTASGQWGREFQAYRLNKHFITGGPSLTFDYGYSTVVTKNLLRGSGRALSLYMHSETGKNMHIYGWSVLYGGRSAV